MAITTLSARVNFIRSILSDVASVTNETGISLEFVLAQVALETGWGSKVLAGTNNLFNIKADSEWTGPTATFTVKEYINGKWVDVESKFRVYNSFEESILDWLNFLQNNPRYSEIFDPDIKGDLNKIAQAMQNAGYATDPLYADKIIKTAKGQTIRWALYYYNDACWTIPYHKLSVNSASSINSLYLSGRNWAPSGSPLVIDLDGDGIETVGIQPGSPILFDNDADGIKTGTGWIKPDDGLLVMDRDGNGTIDTGRNYIAARKAA